MPLANVTIGLNSGYGGDATVVYLDTVSVKAVDIPPCNGPSTDIASDSASTNQGVFNGDPDAWKVGISGIPNGKGLAFDATDDYVSLPSITLTADFSISLWYVPTISSGDGSICGQGDSETGVGSGIQQNATAIRILAASGTTGTIPLSAGVAVHVGVTFTESTNTFRLYIDGVLDGTLVQNVSSTDGFRLGSFSFGGYLYQDNGRIISDARVFNVVKSQPQMAALAAGTDDQTGIVGHWKLDDGAQGSPADGDPILEWTNKGTDREQFQQATYAKRPTYLSSAVGGKAGLVFDGVDDLLVFAASLLTDTTGYAWIIARLTAVPDAYQTFTCHERRGGHNQVVCHRAGMGPLL